MNGFTLGEAYDRVNHLRPVLVVEDEIDILSSLAELLRDDGYDVVTAANGYQALAQAKEHAPELILLDLMMPQMNGWRFLEELHARLPGCRAPVILLSAAPELRREAAELGVAASLGKPFRLEELLRLVHRWCPVERAAQPIA